MNRAAILVIEDNPITMNGSLSNRLAVLEAQVAVFTGLAETLKHTAAVDTVLEELLHRSLDAAGVFLGAGHLPGAGGHPSLPRPVGPPRPGAARRPGVFAPPR